MKTFTFNLPAMYGDHHVVEVRRILLELPGVKSVYASSCYQIAEVSFDPKKVDEEGIKARLDEAGYTEEPAIPVEAREPGGVANGQPTYLRHSAAHEQTGQNISFAQDVPASKTVLWPCPGVGVLRTNGDKEK